MIVFFKKQTKTKEKPSVLVIFQVSQENYILFKYLGPRTFRENLIPNYLYFGISQHWFTSEINELLCLPTAGRQEENELLALESLWEKLMHS